jgi:hypothetical protein
MCNPASAQDTLDGQRLALERDRLALEKERAAATERLEQDKLALERERLAVSRQQVPQTNWTAVSVLLSALIGSGTLLYSFYSLKEQSKLQFKIKAADIAMGDARNETVAFHRARWLKVVFKDLLPDNFGNDFGAKDVEDKAAFSFGNSVERKIELMKLVAEKAPDVDTIINTWRKLNPDDDWFKHFDKK